MHLRQASLHPPQELQAIPVTRLCHKLLSHPPGTGVLSSCTVRASPRAPLCLRNRRLKKKKGICPKAITSWQGDRPRGCQVLPDAATKDFLPLEAAGKISQPFTKQAEIRRPKLFLPG